jgi:hypothetical protein
MGLSISHEQYFRAQITIAGKQDATQISDNIHKSQGQQLTPYVHISMAIESNKDKGGSKKELRLAYNI